MNGETPAMTTTDDDRSLAGSRFEPRPWGGYTVLADGDDCKVKRMTVDPGQRLSYQSHARRAEHWVVVSGIATVTLDGTDIDLGPGQAIDIPLHAAHRVANQGADELVFIEVQMGDYFGEDDIVRYSDDYGRVED